jgi:hypothetical protein
VRSLEVTGSTVSYNYVGVSVTGGTETELSGSSTIEYNATGLLTSGATTTGSTIRNNTTNGAMILTTGNGCVVAGATVEDNGVGLYCSGSGVNPYILFNTIHDNATGVKCDQQATGLFGGNSIESTSIGVFALNGANPNLGNEATGLGGGNSFDRSTYDVSNATQGVTIKAECNSWNPRSGPKVTGIGAVDTDPQDCGEQLTTDRPDVDEAPVDLPTRYELTGARPNPFNPTVTIGYDVPSPGGRVQIEVYDVGGRLVSTLVDEARPAGRHAVTWSGDHAASGVYFVRMTADQFTRTRKIVLLK